MNLTEIYNKTNNSFDQKRQLIFHVGRSAGFYSEYNNMVLAMIYAYINKINFKLYSRFANFGTGQGWEEYFLPFCDSVGGRFHHRQNQRGTDNDLSIKRRPIVKLYRLFHPNTLLTQDVWYKFRNEIFANAQYNIPNLNIYGTLREACRVFCDITYQYNPKTQEKVDSLIYELNLPENFVGMHIRGGDKFLETELLGINPYIEAAESRMKVTDVFVLTDDYRIIETMKIARPNWNIFTFCLPGEKGYFHKKFQNENEQEKVAAHIRLFASTDLLLKSDLFVGTFTSNPGMHIGMRKDSKQCVSVDVPHWFMI